LSKIRKSAVGEYYFGDLIKLAVEEGERVGAYKLKDTSQWKGINTPQELEQADKMMRERLKGAP
jgi:bifunctional UDP-N-acetylglucosamine pyrophosphorylase/glucosamine-1-phosphate N-acetyltransferase